MQYWYTPVAELVNRKPGRGKRDWGRGESGGATPTGVQQDIPITNLIISNLFI